MTDRSLESVYLPDEIAQELSRRILGRQLHAGDPPMAERAAREHLENAERRMVKYMKL